MSQPSQPITREQMITHGVLWRINAILGLDGFTIALDPDSNGFLLYGDGRTPITFPDDVSMQKAEAFRRFRVAVDEHFKAEAANAGPKRQAYMDHDSKAGEVAESLLDAEEDAIQLDLDFDSLDVALALGQVFSDLNRETVQIRIGSGLVRWVSRDDDIEEVVADLQRVVEDLT